MTLERKFWKSWLDDNCPGVQYDTYGHFVFPGGYPNIGFATKQSDEEVKDYLIKTYKDFQPKSSTERSYKNNKNNNRSKKFVRLNGANASEDTIWMIPIGNGMLDELYDDNVDEAIAVTQSQAARLVKSWLKECRCIVDSDKVADLIADAFDCGHAEADFDPDVTSDSGDIYTLEVETTDNLDDFKSDWDD